MMNRWRDAKCAALAAALLITAAGCSAGGSADSSTPTGARGVNPPSPGGSESSDAGSAAAADTALPPERELEGDYRSPVATGKYVWIANPMSGRVAFVDAATLDVRLVDAGNAPTYLAAVPSTTDDAAIVLNVLSGDATLLRATSTTITTQTFKVGPDANAWSVSSDGHWAIAWSDARLVPTSDKTRGFQDITVLDLTGKLPPASLAVGYRPVLVGFTSDKPATRAYAVTQDGVSIVDLAATGASVARNIALEASASEDPITRDVSVTPDGNYALIRRNNDPAVTIVALTTGTRTKISLSGKVTDLDLTLDGKRAIAVVRDTAKVSILPIPGIVDDPSLFTTKEITGETIGSVTIASVGTTALLYSNAAAIERLTVLTLDPEPQHRTARLYSPVLAVFPTPDAGHAVVFHDRVGSSSTSGRRGAFSLLPLSTVLPAKIIATDAPLTAVAFSPSSDRALVTERDDTTKTYGVHLISFPSLANERYALASPPVAVGIVAGAKRAYVAQQHSEGRISFVDLDKGGIRTLTGFELAARVVDGSKP